MGLFSKKSEWEGDISRQRRRRPIARGIVGALTAPRFHLNRETFVKGFLKNGNEYLAIDRRW
jgi:hypothetical protein